MVIQYPKYVCGLCYFFFSILTQGESIFSAFVFACICEVLVSVKAMVCVCAGGWVHLWPWHCGIASQSSSIKSLMSFTVSSSTLKVTGFYGDNVTLSCRYDTQTQSVYFLHFCWGRDKVPISKCSKTILSFEEGAVSYRKSPRYKLLGRLADGDVSLTIVNAQWSDAGVYGCRVEIPGWFNDQKVNVQLVMEEGNAHNNHPGWNMSVKGPLCKKVDFWVSFLSHTDAFGLAVFKLTLSYFFRSSSYRTSCHWGLDTRWVLTYVNYQINYVKISISANL